MAISVSFPHSSAAQPGPGGPLCWVQASSTTSSPTSGFQTNWLPVFTELYRPLNLWNGMFDRHQADITVMQFTCHSLPVHQSMTVPWDFNTVPYRQLSSPMPMDYATSASLERHVWPGRRSIYNNIIHCRLFNAKSCLCIYTKYIWICLVGFHGISIIVGHLMPNPFYTYILNIYNFVWLGFITYQPL